ncbi:glycine-rich cell wall structural protein 1.8-like [Capsicum galapagoense]
MASNFMIMMILGTLMYTTSARKLIGLDTRSFGSGELGLPGGQSFEGIHY